MKPGERADVKSETERHWDQVCLGMVALGAAALAAAFVIMGVGDERDGPIGATDVPKMACAVAAASAYAILVILAGKSILRRSKPAYEAGFQRRKEATRVFEWLVTLAPDTGCVPRRNQYPGPATA